MLVCHDVQYYCVMFIQPLPFGLTAAGTLYLLPHTNVCIVSMYVLACLCTGNVADITLPLWSGVQLVVSGGICVEKTLCSTIGSSR